MKRIRGGEIVEASELEGGRGKKGLGIGEGTLNSFPNTLCERKKGEREREQLLLRSSDALIPPCICPSWVN